MQQEQLDTKPWYKQFWPWFIIALPLSAVIASIATFVIALQNPEHLVVDNAEYKKISAELKPTRGNKISEQSQAVKNKDQN